VLELKQKKIIKELKGVISSGKESRVYWGKDFSNNDIAVKIYLTATAEFRKSIWKYVKGDPRYEWIGKLPHHKLIEFWCQKEFRNLRRMYEAGVRVPRPIAYHRNILVMQFIGENGVRAPLLIEVARDLSFEEAYRIFRDILAEIEKMYWRAGLVHADLSEYNTMVWNGEVYIIDVSQAVLLNHPNAHAFLYRDIQNIVRFFETELGLEVPSADVLYNKLIKGESISALELGTEFEESE